MATVDFSGATISFAAFNPSNIDHNAQMGFSPAFYSWKTSSNFTITALSFANNITATGAGPTGGSINAVNAVDSGFNPIFAVTDISVPLTGLVTPGNAALSQEHFWETVLAGATTFIMPQLTGISADVFGDFLDVDAGQILNGANDRFYGNGSNTSHNAVGDALAVEAGARLNGGNDQFVNLSGSVYGDVGVDSNLGIVKGGNDSFVGTGNPLAPTLAIGFAVGDVFENFYIVSGGADSFNYTNLQSATYIVGDVYSNAAGFVLGGNDKINIAKTGAFHLPSVINLVVGDVRAASATVTGGNDSISVRDAVLTTISGDVDHSSANVTGGSDNIVFASSAPIFSGPPALPPLPPQTVHLVGDARQMTAGNLVGGNDVITVGNAFAGSVAGDAFQISSSAGAVGGNDTISIGWNQINLPALGPFVAAGDSILITGGGFTGGSDTITVNLTMGSDEVSNLCGDANSFSGSGNFFGGNDTVVLNSNRTGGLNYLSGDAQTINTTGAFHGGNDNLTGSNGADVIYGDAATIIAASDIGGNDIINGRGGNDVIDGGLGFDAAVYSSLNQAVFVNLNGIAGSAAAPANWVEAIGQGSDQLIGIERIVGSQLGDVIIGNAVTNIFNGLGGADSLNGGIGNDVLIGGRGNDVLVGGANSDIFQFTTAPNSVSNRDVITDFNHALDTIQLDNAVFAALGAAGPLNAGFFRLGAAAADPDDHIIYNQANGALFYDSNGNAVGGSVMFAVLSTKPAIAADDFVVI
jgi:Ca2+-binding RTX toxin-like protein